MQLGNTNNDFDDESDSNDDEADEINNVESSNVNINKIETSSSDCVAVAAASNECNIETSIQSQATNDNSENSNSTSKKSIILNRKLKFEKSTPSTTTTFKIRINRTVHERLSFNENDRVNSRFKHVEKPKHDSLSSTRRIYTSSNRRYRSRSRSKTISNNNSRSNSNGSSRSSKSSYDNNDNVAIKRQKKLQSVITKVVDNTNYSCMFFNLCLKFKSFK